MGYDRSVGPTDNANPSGGSDYFAIDDVSLVEVAACDITLDPYLPLNFCSSQADRLFRIRNIAAGTPGFTFEWQFFKYDGSGLVSYGASGLPFTKTTQTSELTVHGYQFPAGTYSYRVRAKYTNAAGAICYTAWAGLYPDTFNVEESCTYTPSDDVPRAAPPPEAEEPVAPTAAAAYPNPAAESLTLPEGAEQVLLFSSAGKALPMEIHAGTLDVRGLPEGLYNLRLRLHGKVLNQHIQVKH